MQRNRHEHAGQVTRPLGRQFHGAWGGGGLRMEGRARMNLVIGHAAASFSEHRYGAARSSGGDGSVKGDE
jgi:hypothetical protein